MTAPVSACTGSCPPAAAMRVRCARRVGHAAAPVMPGTRRSAASSRRWRRSVPTVAAAAV
ncbi:hypothetical protein [Ornithinimicrobium kibberense]|uniref:hypothetical protein n=1 Tax=Ornithinimicrobium kibberense TaxID=282060 RepID=UPI00361CD285